VAQTGSGKTMAFILPGIVHVMAQPVLKVNILLFFYF
jgi:superfamily II DNA/RNA helicase